MMDQMEVFKKDTHCQKDTKSGKDNPCWLENLSNNDECRPRTGLCPNAYNANAFKGLR